MSTEGIKLAVLVPAYNEEEVIAETARRLLLALEELMAGTKISRESYICFIDDGSTDRTWSIIAAMHEKSPHIHGFKLSRNFGHQSALIAGLLTCQADAYVSMDADLQDDEGILGRMILEYEKGCDVVYGVRSHRDTDTAFKRHTAAVFYRLMKWMGVDVVSQHADFRLLSARAVRALRGFKESNLFLRALIVQLGFRSAIVEYSRKSRAAGQSKYTLRRMISFAWDGITSFSIYPLRLIAFSGLAVFIGSMALLLYSFLTYLRGHVVPGWTSTILPIYFLGGVQLLCIGILGEYLGKIYKEVKRRPRYIIDCATFEDRSGELWRTKELR